MTETNGDRILRGDMTTQTASFDQFPPDRKLLGGRALSAKILLEEGDPTCDPLGPDNVLVMAPGVLSGTSAPTSGRISMGGKSPLTNGIKEANAGGNHGQHLMRLNIPAIVVKGKPAIAPPRRPPPAPPRRCPRLQRPSQELQQGVSGRSPDLPLRHILFPSDGQPPQHPALQE